MLNMKVLDYRITSDARQVVVGRVRKNDKGEISMVNDPSGKLVESQSVVGYFSNLSKALIGIQRDYVLHGDKEINTIKEYTNELQTITNEFEACLNIGESFD